MHRQFSNSFAGRGFVACFLHESDYEVIFADVVEPLVNSINENPTYKVIEVGIEGVNEKTIRNYRAINSKTDEARLIDEIATADVITCSVGPNILKFIAPPIAKGIDKRPANLPPLAVIACENAIGATDTLASFIKDEKNTPANRLESHSQRARYANSAIDRIVPAQDADAGLDVKLEKFYEWVVDKTPFAGTEIPSINGIHWVDNLEPFIERKLYTVNTGHATAAYLGYSRHHATVNEALQDPYIFGQVHKALEETSELIISKHGIPREEQKAYAEKIIKRISNPHLADAVERVGRAPLRKLSRKERFIGPASQLAEKGKDVSALLSAAEQAFRFQNIEGDDESKELAKIVSENKPFEIVRKVCGIEESHPLFSPLVDVVKRVKGQVASL
jgi:mannitol-1-phosphate 5-dehydrogenase